MNFLKKLTVLASTLLLSGVALFANGVTETQSAVNTYTSDAAPKYVFMFIGDGMSSPQTNAAQIINGNNEKGFVELNKLTFTQFPVAGIQYTQDSTSFCPDSASTATSLSSGFKTHSGVIGMGVDKVTKGVTIAEKLRDQKDWKIGIISSVTLNHATPAAYYAHVPNRNSYYEIGLQLADSGFDYVAGGSLKKPEDGGRKSLYKVMEDKGWTVTNDKDTILSLNSSSAPVYAISPALQDDGAMKYAIDSNEGELQLKDFVKKGIDVLDNENGFFMMIEGGKIDWAGHANDAAANIYDTIALDEAVKVALDFAMLHPDETLILVTGDHETGGMTIGYAATGYDTAFKLLKNQKMSYVAFDEMLSDLMDGLSFEGLLALVEENFGLVAPGKTAVDPALVMNDYEYAKLKDAYEAARSGKADTYEDSLLYGGYNPISVTLTHILNNKAGIGWTSYSHTGLPVPVYAFGAGAELFGGTYDNTEIAKRLMTLTDVR